MFAGKDGFCNPSLATLAKEMNASLDTIGRWMSELTVQRFIRRRRHGRRSRSEARRGNRDADLA